MKQAGTLGVNTAESDALWKKYGLWVVYYIKFLKELSYGVVINNF